MSSDSASIRAAIDIRTIYMQRLRENRSAGNRLADFAKLQQASLSVLCASPRGYRHFMARNLHSRRVEVINGKWKPVSPARRSQQA